LSPPERELTAVLVAIHLVTAGIWFGGSTALVFVGVPAVRVAEGESRSRAMRELGLRWRPLGYGALLVAAVTGALLAVRDWQATASFETVLAVKAAVFACLLVVSYLHNFVYGPRVQAEVRAGGPQPTRPRLVVIGWLSYSLTMALPVLGVALQRLA
jgi:putative copper export protein